VPSANAVDIKKEPLNSARKKTAIKRKRSFRALDNFIPLGIRCGELQG
jgi:hypothetical protein